MAETASRQETDVDVLVVGAGPAGAMAAMLLARAGCRVRLVEKSAWPRPKVCGGCLSSAAVAMLASAGLGHVLETAGAPAFDRLALYHGGGGAVVPLGGGRAISRERLDARLVEQAQREGAVFTCQTRAEPAGERAGYRIVALTRHGARERVRAGVVVAADGLAGRVSAAALGRPSVGRSARLGLGAVLEPGDGQAHAAGTIHMGWCPHGYIGAVRVEGQRLCLAAAVEPRWLSRWRGKADALARALAEAAMPPVAGLCDDCIRGTPLLTRRRQARSAHRLLAIGDAAGYVEPFTGEGMTWALAGAVAAVPFVLENLKCWDERASQRWTEAWQRLMGGRHRACEMFRLALRQGWLVRPAMRLAGGLPAVAGCVAGWVQRPVVAWEGR